ncbi:hypothetical protein [Glutamicibacter creatinolyticus]|uniref:hypothetical protein n=1 Tax=Glutamicibacter creatinolyticus TaxID=162496 RepID=UPI00321669F8
MAETRVIGAVAVKVRPDVGGFRRKTKAGILKELRNVEGEVKVNVDADLDVEKFRRQLRELKRDAENSRVSIGVDIDGLREALKGVDRELAKSREALVKLDATLSEHAKRHVSEQVDDLVDDNDGKEIDLKVNAHTAGASAHLKYTARTRFVDLIVRVNKRSMAIAEGVLQSLAGWNVITQTGRALESLVTQFDKITVKAGGWGAVLGALVNTLSYVGTAALGVADGLAKSVGLLATMPAGLAALASVVTINVAAWKNFGDAVNGDNKALATLPVNAQKAAKSLRGAWTQIQRPVQRRFWEGMGDELSKLARVIIPQFRDGLSGSALHAGKFGAGVARSFRKIALNGDLKKMFKGLDGFFENLAGAAEPFVDALNTLGLRGSEYLPQFGKWLTDLAVRFDNFIQKADEAGDINRWIEDGVTALQDMWRVGGGAINMMRGLTRAARDAGVGGLSRFADSMERVGDMMMGEPFRSRMANIFRGANAGASELNAGVKDLGRAIGESSIFVGDLLEGLGKLGGTALKGVARAFREVNFQDGIREALDGLNAGAEALGPTFSSVGNIIGDLGRIAGQVFRNIAPLLNTLSGALEDVLAALGPSLSNLVPALMGTLGGALRAVAPLVVGLAQGLSVALDAFNALPGPIKNVALALAGLYALRAGGFFTGVSNGMRKVRDAFTQVTPITTTAQATMGRQVVMMQRHLNSINANKFERVMQSLPLTAKRAFSGMTAALGGGWGIAITAAVAALGAIGAEADRQKAHVESLRSTLDGLRVTGGTRDTVVGAFAEDSQRFSRSTGTMADAAKRLGVSLDDMVAGATGSREALARVQKQAGEMSWAGRWVSEARDGTQAMEMLKRAGVDVQTGFPAMGLGVKFKQWIGGHFQTDSDRVINGMQEQSAAIAEAQRQAMEFATMKGADPRWAEEYATAIEVLGDNASTTADRLTALRLASKIKAGFEVELGDSEQAYNDGLRNIGNQMKSLAETAREAGKKLDLTKYLNKDGTIRTSDEIGSTFRTMFKSIGTAGVDYAMHLAESFDTPAERAKAFRDQMEVLRKDLNQKFKLDLDAEEFNEVLRGLGMDPVEIETQLKDGAGRELKNEVDGATKGAEGEVKVDVEADTSKARSDLKVLKSEADQLAFKKYLASLGIESTDFDLGVMDALAKLLGFDAEKGTASLDAESEGFDSTREFVLAKLQELNGQSGTAKLDADDQASPKVGVVSALVRMFSPVGTAKLEAEDGVTGPVTAAKLVVGTLKGKAIEVLASFVAENYPGLKTQYDNIKGKIARIIASFTSSNYGSTKGQQDSIRDKIARIAANFMSSAYGTIKSQYDNIRGKFVSITASFFGNGYWSVKSMIDNIKGKTVRVVTNFVTRMFGNGMDGGFSGVSGVGNLGIAKGLPKSRAIKQFANGGIEPHVAQIAYPSSNTPIRIWAEPETGGEAYIPLSPTKRQRSLAIWRETGRRLGADFYEDGGITGGAAEASSSAAPTFNITNHYPVAEKTSTTVNRALQYASIPGLSAD